MNKVIFISTIHLLVILSSCKNINTSAISHKNRFSKVAHLSIKIDSNKLNFGDYTKGLFTFYDKKDNIIYEKKQLKIKYRGNSSAHYDKKSFSVKFSNKMCYDRQTCHKKWKLNAEYIDKTFMRNKLSYDLFNLFNKNNIAPKIFYLTVDINNVYNGIYALTEKVDSDLLNFRKDDTNSVLFKDPPISITPQEHGEKYLNCLEFINWSDYYKKFSEKAMRKIINQTYYNQRYPGTNKSNKKYLIHEITEFIFNSKNEEFSNEDIFNKYFDIDNILDWHLLLLLTNNEDGLLKNFYLYSQGIGKPFKFCPWDYDHSFGRDGDGELNHKTFLNADKVELLNRLVKTNTLNYNERLLNKFLILKRKDILTAKNINKMIDNNISLLKNHIEKNEDRWPSEKIHHFSNSTYLSEINLMRKWIEKRLDKVESHLFKLQKTK